MPLTRFFRTAGFVTSKDLTRDSGFVFYQSAEDTKNLTHTRRISTGTAIGYQRNRSQEHLVAVASDQITRANILRIVIFFSEPTFNIFSTAHQIKFH